MRWTRSFAMQQLLLVLATAVLLSLVYFTVIPQKGFIASEMQRHNMEIHSGKMNLKGPLFFAGNNSNVIDKSERRVTSDEIIRDRFLARNQHARRVCSLYRAKKMNFTIYPHKRPWSFANGRLKWCRNYKVASSFILRLFHSISDETKNVTNTTNFLGKIFITVREPYSRLVSGYIDKILLFPPFWQEFGTQIIHEFRPNSSTSNNISCGHDVTFPEFIEYFIHAQENGELENLHFAPMSYPCNPCQKHYDYICHLETIKEDMAYLLKVSNLTYHHLDLSIDESELKEKVTTFFTKEERVTRCESMCDAFRTLWWTFQARGLLPSGLSFPLSESECRNNLTQKAFGQMCWDKYKQYVGTFDKHQQIRKTIVDLFLQVPLKDRIRIRDLLALDFQLNGYEDQPDDIFPELAKAKKT